jgi:hypothetical protein
MSEMARLIGVLTDPKRAFADIVRQPRWWVPLSLLVILAVAFNVAFTQRVGWERYLTQTFENNPRMQNMPADQRALAMERAVKITPIIGYAGAIVGWPVYVLAMAGVLMLVFNVAFRARLKFRQTFGVTSYAQMPVAVSKPLEILVMFLKNPDDFNLQNPLAFNLGAFLDPQGTPKWLLSLGTSLDLFSFWIVLLLAIGLAAASRKITFGKALVGVAAPWLVLVLVKCAWAGMFG